MPFRVVDATKCHITHVMRLSGRFQPFSGVSCANAQPLCADMQTKVSFEWLEQRLKRQSYLLYL